MEIKEFDNLVKYVNSLKIKSRRVYLNVHNKYDLPKYPNIKFKKFWISWNHWLGNDSKFCGNKKILKYEKAIVISRSLGLKTKKEWEDYMFDNKRIDLPRRPDKFYEEWVSWSDWLGNDSRSDRKFPKIEECKNILKSNNINTKNEYLNSYKVLNLPSNPLSKYNIESWNELFDKKKSNNYLEFEECREIVRNMGLSSQKIWFKMCSSSSLPDYIPKSPNKYYKEWISWNDWLGHGITTNKKFMSYTSAKSYLSEIGLTSLQEYNHYLICNSIDFLPMQPSTFYKGEYESISKYLSYKSDRISYGEKIIKSWLDLNRIEYEQQKEFEECVNKKNLRFDFYISDKNLCIEFDGRQHYEPIDYFGGIDGFLYRKKLDNLKNEFCRVTGISLIRISYEDINIVFDILNQVIEN